MLNAVVICLKNRTFAVSQTTLIHATHLPHGLWFAWKIVLLQYRKQHLHSNCPSFWCCDLLEKSYFCSIANNSLSIILCTSRVVICLKNRTFAVSQTTVAYFKLSRYALWFAWKIVLLQYRKQRHHRRPKCNQRCDLLEKSYFCSIANNFFDVETTGVPLWFAWKIVLLQYRKQHSVA